MSWWRRSKPRKKVLLMDYYSPEDGEDKSPALLRAYEDGAREIQLPWGKTHFISFFSIKGELKLIHANGYSMTIDQSGGSWYNEDMEIDCGEEDDDDTL